MNQFNRIVIRYEKRMTPKERRWLVREIESVWSVPVLAAPLSLIRQRFSRIVGRSARRSPNVLKDHALDTARRWRTQARGFSRTTTDWDRVLVTRGYGVYRRRPGRSSSRLLIAFTGGAQRIGLPMPVFLQSLADIDTDVLALWAGDKGDYGRGIPGLGSNFSTALTGVENLVRQFGYERCAVVGSSAGGVPALVYSLAHSEVPFLLFGSANPERSQPNEWAEVLKLSGASDRQVSGVSVVGDSAPDKDLSTARYLEDKIGCQVVITPGGHSPVHLLAYSGELAPMIERLFMAPEASLTDGSSKIG